MHFCFASSFNDIGLRFLPCLTLLSTNIMHLLCMFCVSISASISDLEFLVVRLCILASFPLQPNLVVWHLGFALKFLVSRCNLVEFCYLFCGSANRGSQSSGYKYWSSIRVFCDCIFFSWVLSHHHRSFQSFWAGSTCSEADFGTKCWCGSLCREVETNLYPRMFGRMERNLNPLKIQIIFGWQPAQLALIVRRPDGAFYIRQEMPRLNIEHSQHTRQAVTGIEPTFAFFEVIFVTRMLVWWNLGTEYLTWTDALKSSSHTRLSGIHWTRYRWKMRQAVLRISVSQ